MKRSVLVIFFALVLLDSSSRADAHPLDSPGTVYIDGLPCDSFCQPYMAWYRAHFGQRPPSAVSRHFARMGSQPHRTARQVAARYGLSAAKAHGGKAKIGTSRRPSSTPPANGDRLVAVGQGPTEAARTTPSAPGTPPQSSVSQLPPDSHAGEGKAPATMAAKEMDRARDQPKTSDVAQDQQPTQLPSEDTDIKAMDARQPDVASKHGDNAPGQTGSTTPNPASQPNGAVSPVHDNTLPRQQESQQFATKQTNQEVSKDNAPRAEPSTTPPHGSGPDQVKVPDTTAVAGKQAGAENKPNTETKTEAAVAQGETPSTASPPSSDAKFAEAKPTENLASPPSADATDSSRSRALEHQIRGAAAVAEQLTLATTNHPDAFDNPLSNDSRNDNTHLAVLVLARSDIKSVAELAGKTIAMDDIHLSSKSEVRSALVAAGATDIQIHGEGRHAVDQLVEGQVPAAILTVVSPDAAGAFPDVLGFKLFAISLSPSTVNGKTIDP
jgi:hypothetical protein